MSLLRQELKRGGTAPSIDNSKQYSNFDNPEGIIHPSEFKEATINNLRYIIFFILILLVELEIIHSKYQNNF